jgi:hypothetical protein
MECACFGILSFQISRLRDSCGEVFLHFQLLVSETLIFRSVKLRNGVCMFRDFGVSHFGIFCHAIIVMLLVLPLSLVHHRRAELAINDNQILCLLSIHGKYANRVVSNL